jgi:hypothetical protein
MEWILKYTAVLVESLLDMQSAMLEAYKAKFIIIIVQQRQQCALFISDGTKGREQYRLIDQNVHYIHSHREDQRQLDH